MADRFYRGRILKLFRGTRGGVVVAESGREVPFSDGHVLLIGLTRRFEDLREGMPVGFDVGWTSGGLRVTVLQTEPRPSQGPSLDNARDEPPDG